MFQRHWQRTTDFAVWITLAVAQGCAASDNGEASADAGSAAMTGDTPGAQPSEQEPDENSLPQGTSHGPEATGESDDGPVQGSTVVGDTGDVDAAGGANNLPQVNTSADSANAATSAADISGDDSRSSASNDGPSSDVSGDSNDSASNDSAPNDGDSGAGPDGSICTSPNIDIRTTTISGALRVNGATLDEESEGVGSFYLENAAGDYVDLARLPGAAYTRPVMPGSYDLYFAAESGSVAPFGTRSRLRSGIEVGAEPLVLDIDLPLTQVSTTVTLNGEELEEETSSVNGFLELRRGNEAAARLGSVAGGTMTTFAVPGTYDLYYSVYSRNEAELPSNTSAKLQSGIVIGDTQVSLEVDVPMTTVSIALTIAGASRTQATPDSTILSLENDAGDKVELTVTSATGASSGPIIPGLYDLYYTAYDNWPDAPRNTHAKIQSVMVGNGPVSLAVDIPATLVSGALTVNGETVEGLSGETVLALRSSSGDTLDLLPDEDGVFSALVVSGTYDLIYGVNRSAVVVGAPGNRNTPLQRDLVVTGSSQVLDVDIPVTQVSSVATLNGAALSGSIADEGEGWTYLQRADGGEVSLAGLHGPSSVLAIPGTYDLYYRLAQDGPGVPCNMARLKSGVVVAATALELSVDVPAVTVSGSITLNGASIADVPEGGSGRLILADEAGSESTLAVLFPSTDPENADVQGAYSVLVVPGAFDISYRAYSAGPALPSNQRGALGCFEVK